MPGSGQKAGTELRARWREAGAWWQGEPQSEHAEWIEDGARRTTSRQLQPLDPEPIQKRDVREGRDDYSLRPYKTRDEKVSKACGLYVDELSGEFCVAKNPYAPLHVLSGYSFGRSIMLARELPRRAAYLGLPAVAIADRFALTGAMELSREADKCGIKPLIGATIELAEGGEIVLIAKSKRGYRSLSHLVTACHLREPRLFPLCDWARLEERADDLICLTGGDEGPLNRALAAGDHNRAREIADRLIGLYGKENMFVEIERSSLPWELSVNRRLLDLADSLKLTPVAGA